MSKQKLPVTMWSTTLVVLGPINPVFQESHRKLSGHTPLEDFIDSVTGDGWLRFWNKFAEWKNIQMYTLCFYFRFSQGTPTWKEIHGLRLKHFLHTMPVCHSFLFFLNYKIKAKSKYFHFPWFSTTKSVIHIRSRYTNKATFYLKILEFQRMTNVLHTSTKVTKDFLFVVYELQKIVDNFTLHAWLNFGK